MKNRILREKYTVSILLPAGIPVAKTGIPVIGRLFLGQAASDLIAQPDPL